MNKKYTIEHIKESFAKEGYDLLSTEYVNNKQKLEYRCPKGHRGSISYHNFQQGQRCRQCAILSRADKDRLDIEYIKESFAKEGYELLTKIYKNAFQKLEYRCPNGHYDEIIWNNWQQGKRCPICAGNKKLDIKFIREQLAKEGYQLLSTEYKNNQQKLEYICPKGHQGSISYRSFQQGHRCPKCFFENNKGPNNPNFNPNLTDEDRQQNRCLIPGYTEWRKAVFERDNYTCQICGKRGGKLNAHHKESFNNNPALRTALENGICICEDCHKDFHHQYGRGNNTREQFEEFRKNFCG